MKRISLMNENLLRLVGEVNEFYFSRRSDTVLRLGNHWQRTENKNTQLRNAPKRGQVN